MPRFRVCVVLLILIYIFLLLPSSISFVQDSSGQSTVKSSSENIISMKKSSAEESSATIKEESADYIKSTSKEVASPEDNLNGQEQEEEKNIMEGALELLDNSQEEWAKGDLESALDLLDQAYSLILDTDGTPDIARQKDDLRLIISKKILAIYSSMQTVTNGKRSEIPLIINADVEKEIRSFQTVEKEFFIQSYKRSVLYRPVIIRELKKAGIPEELSWLPLVESGFKVCALSRARALGLWQFIPSTGYKYNLNRDDWIDERLDVEKSTRAAIDYLKELHNMFGDWLTVLAAYNCGEGRVIKVISRQHLNYLDRFWDLYHQLPYETARYVPRFLATLHIIKNPQKYDMDLNDNLNDRTAYLYETVKTNKSMRLQDIATHLNISEDILNTLNAELRHKITPDKEYQLKVPIEMAEKFINVADQIPQWEQPKKIFVSPRSPVVRHRVKRGETVASIARKYKISAKAIKSYNHLSNRKVIRVGQYIKVPISGYRYSKLVTDKKSNNNYKSEEIMRYKVKKGDTMSSIAKNFGTTVSNIRSNNRLKSSVLMIGQILIINNKSRGNSEQIYVKKKS